MYFNKVPIYHIYLKATCVSDWKIIIFLIISISCAKKAKMIFKNIVGEFGKVIW